MRCTYGRTVFNCSAFPWQVIRVPRFHRWHRFICLEEITLA